MITVKPSYYRLPWPILGFTGKAGAGKDTAAEILYNFCRCRRMSFSYPLKAMLSTMLGEGDSDFENREWKENTLPDIGRSPRELLQTLGTEWGRDLVHPDLWVLLAAKRVKKDGTLSATVFTDVRFPNEEKWIRRMGGVVVRIERPSGTTNVGKHSSESQNLHADIIIYNDRDLATLQSRVREVLLEKVV